MGWQNFIININFLTQTKKRISSVFSLYYLYGLFFFFMIFSLALENRSLVCSPETVQGYLWTACNSDSDDISKPLQDRMSDRVNQHVKIH